MNCNNYIRRVAGVTRTYAWTILTNGEPESLEGRNLTLVLVHPRGREEIMEFGAIGNVVTFTWQGDDQKDIGRYSIILYENYGEENQLRVDIHNFVELVPWSERESGDYADLTEESESLESDVIREEVLVVDNLLSTSASSALSANMGRVLNESKQDKLVSGQNIKTINNESILGSGNIDIEGGGGDSSLVHWVFTEEGTLEHPTWNTDGHKYSDIVTLDNEGKTLLITMIDLDGFNIIFEYDKFGILLPLVEGFPAMYLVSEGENDSIELTHANLIHSLTESTGTSLQPFERNVELFGDDTINDSIVNVANVKVDADGVAITTTNGVTATYNGEEIYTKPSGGIPKTDLSSDVQTSLDNADAAILNRASSSGGVLIKASNNSSASIRTTDTTAVIQGRAGSVTVDDTGVNVQTGNSGFPDAKMLYNGQEVATKNQIPDIAGKVSKSGDTMTGPLVFDATGTGSTAELLKYRLGENTPSNLIERDHVNYFVIGDSNHPVRLPANSKINSVNIATVNDIPDNANLVHKTGNETISGKKTFEYVSGGDPSIVVDFNGVVNYADDASLVEWFDSKSDKVQVVNASTQPATLRPNKVYQMGTLTGSVTIPAFAAVASGDTEVKIWCFTFNTSTTAPTITWPAGITAWSGGSAPTINASKSYEVTVMDGIGVIIEA